MRLQETTWIHINSKLLNIKGHFVLSGPPNKHKHIVMALELCTMKVFAFSCVYLLCVFQWCHSCKHYGVTTCTFSEKKIHGKGGVQGVLAGNILKGLLYNIFKLGLSSWFVSKFGKV